MVATVIPTAGAVQMSLLLDKDGWDRMLEKLFDDLITLWQLDSL